MFDSVVAGACSGTAVTFSDVITGLVPMIPVDCSAAPHRIGMAGTSPAMTGRA